MKLSSGSCPATGASIRLRAIAAISSMRASESIDVACELLKAFCEKRGVDALSKVTIDILEDYRRSRLVGLVTWNVELQTLRTFFGYCVSRKWLTANPAKELKPPRNLKPNEVVPYTLQEESRILTACDQIGGGKYHRSGASYEQLRARAMVMLLRHTALRVSDVATLRKDAISWDSGPVHLARASCALKRAASRSTCRSPNN